MLARSLVSASTVSLLIHSGEKNGWLLYGEKGGNLANTHASVMNTLLLVSFAQCMYFIAKIVNSLASRCKLLL